MKTNVVMSMVNPSTDALMTKVESRYGLVVLAARRARQLMTGAEVRAKNQSTKSVTNALEEIVEGKITYEIAKDLPEEQEALLEAEEMEEPGWPPVPPQEYEEVTEVEDTPAEESEEETAEELPEDGSEEKPPEEE